MSWYGKSTPMRKALSGIKYFKAKKIANNTYRYQVEDRDLIRFNISGIEKRVRLHMTDIITEKVNQLGQSVFILNTGGYKTITTKDRLNRFGPLNIWSERGIWYASDRSENDSYTVSYFFDGITAINGKIANPDIPIKKARYFTSEKNKLQAHFDFAERG